MNWAKFFIEKNRVTVVFILLLLLGGINAYLKFPRSEDPEFTIRTCIIQTYFEGASPQKIEKLITDKIERKLQQIPQIDYILSQNRTGVSLITVKVKDKYKNLAPIWQKIKDKVKEIKDLPQGASKPYVWDDFGDVFGIVLALTGDGYTYRELKNYAEDIRSQLLKVKDVAKIELYGTQQEAVYVEISSRRLKSLGITPLELVDSLKKQNIVLPAGSIDIGPEKIVIEPTGNFESLDDIKKTVIAVSSQRTIFLSDIAQVRQIYRQPPSSIVRFNGERAVALAVNMAKGGNIVKLGEEIKKEIKKIRKQLPVGLNINIVCYQPKEVIKATSSFMINLLQAVILVVLVMILFLGVRTGIIVASLIPLTILASFLIMQFLGVSLHRVSIASLIIALGLMVDCAIVVSEHILVHLNEGAEKIEAVVKTTKELKVPLLTSSLTTAVAFLPIALAKSGVGEYCFSLFEVVTIALLSSWFLSLTIIPFLCYFFLKRNNSQKTTFLFSKTQKIAILVVLFGFSFWIAKIPLFLVLIIAYFFFRKFIFSTPAPIAQKERFSSSLYRFYLKVLKTAFLNRKKYIVAIALLFIVSLFCFNFVKQIFFPPSDRPQFFVHFWMPDGTSINYTAKKVKVLENFLKKQKNITSFISYIGEGGPRFFLTQSPELSSQNYAYVLINTSRYKYVPLLMRQVKVFLKKNIPEANCSVRQLESASTVGYPIQVRISGPSMRRLDSLARQLEKELLKIDGLEAVNNNWGNKIKKLVIKVNQQKAKRLRISSEDIAYSLSAMLGGAEITSYRKKRTTVPVVLRLKDYNKDIPQLETLNIYSSEAKLSVPLSQIASLSLVWEPSKIFRRNRIRTITIRADVKEGYLASRLFNKIKPLLSKISANWPEGYTYAIGGEEEENAKANRDILRNVPLALFIILALMVIQFNSFRQTFIIFSTVLMALIGVSWGLILTDSAFGFMAFLGVISLAGIVINDAIVLLDRIRIEKNIHPVKKAIIISCFSHVRPIILTSVTTVGGLFPLALRGGLFWSPMAITIMSGLIFSTTLTLIFVPVLYSIFYRIKFKEDDFSEKILAKE